MTSIPSSQILLCLKPLRRDGIFVKHLEYFDEKGIEFGLTLANYITDTDGGRDVECLYEKGLEPDSCYCEEITCGTESPGCPCPFCGVPTRRYALKERLYTTRLKASLEEGVSVVMNGTISSFMLTHIILHISNTISEIKNLLPPLDLSGSPCPSYGE
jgi:hypothetical protein